MWMRFWIFPNGSRLASSLGRDDGPVKCPRKSQAPLPSASEISRTHLHLVIPDLIRDPFRESATAARPLRKELP